MWLQKTENIMIEKYSYTVKMFIENSRMLALQLQSPALNAARAFQTQIERLNPKPCNKTRNP